ncbi:MAG: penicillin-binding protein activator LpoB [Treponema sp.]|jgi:TolB-like protein|nr:penicillin-binding protein activator LpoB [Treponema sp.]
MIYKKLAVVLLAAAFVNAVFAKDNLAVLPFTGGTAVEGETIAELFSFSNELNTAFAPIPRTSITRAISSEQNFQTSAGMTDPDTIAAIGRQLGAKYVVAGNIGKLGNQNLLIISILKIDDLRQIAGDIQTYKDIEEIRDKLPGMAQTIIEATEIDSAQLDKLAVTPVDLGENIDARLTDTLAQILSINLIKSKKYAVYPRTTTLEQVQTEYSTQASGITADESMVDIGRGENPRFVLSVVARQLGNLNMFNASIINLESGVQIVGRSVNYQSLNDGIAVMESLAQELTATPADPSEIARMLAEAEAAAAEAKNKPKRVKQSGGAVFGYGVLNLALGLGSLIQGDVPGWLVTFLSYGAAAGLVAWDLSLDYEYELMGIEFAGIPGAVGFGIAGFAILYGFIRPAVVNHNRGLAKIMDSMDIAVVPRWDGRETIRLAYSVKF